MTGRASVAWLAAALFVFAPAIAISQTAGHYQTLIVNGQSTQVSVIEVHGRPYVDVNALAGAMNGSISSLGNRIALSVPVGSASSRYATNTTAESASEAPPTTAGTQTSTSARAPAAAPAPAPESNPGFSKAFLNAGIEEMATLREWHAALASLIENGYISADALAPFRAAATTKLNLAMVAATTSSDRLASGLLNEVFQNMVNLSDKYINMRANLTFISPDALDHDPLNYGIVGCGHLLRAMAASGRFEDDGSCD